MPALALGAPGIYQIPAQAGRALRGVRLDVCAFVGVASRGPARVPLVDEHWRDERPPVEPLRPRRRSAALPLDSWDAFRRLYGDGGPGYLPRAVEAFFRQGGRRAYVVRVVHRYGLPAGGFDPLQALLAAEAASADLEAALGVGDAAGAAVASAALQAAQQRDDAGVACGPVAGARTPSSSAVMLTARDEGAWGNGLKATLHFEARPLAILPLSTSTATLALPYGSPLAAGTLLRLTLPGGARVLRFVSSVSESWEALHGERLLLAVLDVALTDPPSEVETVAGVLEVDDADGRHETHAALGLAFGHPRWAAQVLCSESTLVWPDASWAEGALLPLDVDLRPAASDPATIGSETDPFRFRGGRDRFAEIVPDDCFDVRYVPGDDEPRDGIHSLAGLEEVALCALPDLYHPRPAPVTSNVIAAPTLAGPEFAPCVAAAPPAMQASPPEGLDGLLLDPSLPADFEAIVGLQRRVVTLAEERRAFIALLDVPPGLRPRRLLDWRARFDTSFAAAYHPWLKQGQRAASARPVGPGPLRLLPPSAVAAGVIAKRELLFGLPHGPAYELAADVVALHEGVPAALHDELHPLGLNVFQVERGGVRLTGARTLSRDPAWRQLGVRRLVMHLVRVLEREMQWLVFEPNTAALRGELRQSLRAYLRRLYAQGAFQGGSEEQAFFVRCDDELNSARVIDEGRLLCEVGVAPAEPLEFIVLRIARDHDGGLSVTG